MEGVSSTMRKGSELNLKTTLYEKAFFLLTVTLSISIWISIVGFLFTEHLFFPLLLNVAVAMGMASSTLFLVVNWKIRKGSGNSSLLSSRMAKMTNTQVNGETEIER